MTSQNRALGLASAAAVIVIWSGFIVFSRAGVTTGLTAYDVTALRFMVAGLVSLPFALFAWPRHLPLRAQAMIAFSGPGMVYSLLMYLGLSQASAAYGGVFANGGLPVFTMVIAWLIGRERPNRGQIAGAVVILAGAVLMAWRGMSLGGANVAFGITLFLAASATVAFYAVVLRRWRLTPWQILAVVNLPNALIYLPLWYFALPSTLDQAPQGAALFQALFQGLGPGVLAAVFFALSATHLGPTPTAGFSAAVPATATVLAIPVLHEVPLPLEWAGIAVVTLGLALIVRSR